MTRDAETTLELDDIQSGVLRPRPTPYAATYIVFRLIHFEHPNAGQGLGREGFVELNEVNVFKFETGPLECFLSGRHGTGAHHGRIDARHGGRDHFGQRLKTERLRALFAHDQQGGCAIVERRAVAGRHGAHARHKRRR